MKLIWRKQWSMVVAVVAVWSGMLPATAADLELVFLYGSEKKKWVDEVTATFNQGDHRVGARRVVVKATAMGSGEAVDAVLGRQIQAHVLSPASAAFIKLGNARSQAATGQPLVGDSRNLVLSPVVIAMWKPMAEALGWGQKPLGWQDIIAVAQNPKGWEAFGHPEWGSVKLGHTHPEYSNSGLIAVLAEIFAATGKQRGLTAEDLQKPETAEYLRKIERAIVHYGSSTGFFGRKMFANGPTYMSAAVLYENMVIESYAEKGLAFPLVAIYPKEGTFWSDHPAAIVQRPWVTAEHRQAADAYLQYLLAADAQGRALKYGFRPADPALPVGAPVDAAHGVDPAEPKATLEVPSAKLIEAMIGLWRQQKKHANLVLVLDVSGSMSQQNKIAGAKAGASEMLKLLNDADTVSLLVFNDRLQWAATGARIGTARNDLLKRVAGLFPGGGTALYDATAAAYDQLERNRLPDTIAAVVVLSDGADTNSKNTNYQALLKAIATDFETRNTRVFTIGYGKDAKADVLTAIADATAAKFYAGSADDIREVFKDISTFF